MPRRPRIRLDSLPSYIVQRGHDRETNIRQKTRRVAWFAVLALVLLFGLPPTSFAGLPEGLGWLGSQQNADGSFGGTTTSLATPVQSTAEVVRSFQTLSAQGQSGYAPALSYLNTDSESNTEYLSRRIVVNSLAGNNVSALVSGLALNQNLDGGFGDQPGYGSSILDSAYAAEALVVAGQGGSAAAGFVVGYLLTHQLANGAFLDGANDPSVFLTAKALRALWYYRNTYQGVTAALAAAKTYLLSQRAANGLWAGNFNTALALIALIPSLPDLSSVSTSIAALQSAQLGNGSWDNDPYTTALALQALYLASLPVANPDYATIKGQVVDAQTGLPLSGVTAALTGAAALNLTTGSDGQFLFQSLPAGSYSLNFTLANYGTISASLTLSPGQTADLGALLMTKGATATTGTVQGTVTDAANGLPLSDVSITVTGVSGSVLTSASGSYQITNVPPGTVTVTAFLAGYAQVSGSGTLGGGGLLLFSPALVSTSGSTPLGGIQGVVTQASNGAALAGVTIQVSGALSAQATTGLSGNFYIDVGQSKGPIGLAATLAGYDTASANANLTPGSTVIFSPRLYPANSTPPGVNSASVAGVVVDAGSDQPIAGVSITATLGSTTKTATTDAQGRFTVTGLDSAAAVTLNFSHTGYLAAVLEVVLEPLEALDLGRIRLLREGAIELLPDLTIPHLDRAQVATDPQSLVVSGAITARIENAGTASAPNGVGLIAYYDANANRVLDAGDTVLGSATTDAQLLPDAEMSVVIPLQGSVPFRDAPISVWVDSGERVIEANEENNIASTAQSCERQAAVATPLRYYGYSPKANIYDAPVVTLAGYSSNTSYVVRKIGGGILGSGTLNRLSKAVVSVGAGTPFVIEAGAPLFALLHQNCCGTYTETGSFFYPTTDGATFYGKSFVVPRIGLTFNNYSWLVVFASEQAVVTVRHPSGVVVAQSPVLAAGGTWRVPNVNNGVVYSVSATGNIAIANHSANGSALIPPVSPDASDDNQFDDTGRLFYFPMRRWVRGSVAVMNPLDTPATISIYNLANGAAVVSGQTINPKEIYYNNTFSDGYYKLEAQSGAVSLWAGGTEGGLGIEHMGDDLTTNLGYNGTDFVINSQIFGAQLFAGYDGTTVTIGNNPPIALDQDDYVLIPPVTQNVIRSDQPVTVQAIGGDPNYTFNDYATNLRPMILAGGASADLTAGSFRIMDQGTGQPLSLRLQVGNAGAIASPDGVLASFYQGDPAAGGVLLGSLTLSPLAPGEYRDIELAGVTLPGSADLHAIVDPAGKVSECNEANNRVQIPVAAAVLQGTIAVSTDSPAYGPATPAVLNASVVNTGALPASFIAQLRVEDAEGNLVTEFAPRAVGPLAGGGGFNFGENWNTGTTLAGAYRLRGLLFNPADHLVAESLASFTIGALAGGPVATLRVTTDRPTYHTIDTVNIASLAVNASSNVLIDSANLRLTVFDPANQLVFTKDQALGQLPPGASREVLTPDGLTNAPEGSYRIEGRLLDGSQNLLASATTAFEVKSDPTKALSGKVVAARASLEVGETQTCTDTLTNNGTVALDGLEVHHGLVNLDTQSLVSEKVVTVSLPAGGQNVDVRNLPTTGLLPGNHACVLQVNLNGTLTTLAYASFLVTEPSIRIDASLKLGSKGRLLVLLDSPLLGNSANAQDDPHGPSGAPKLDAQRAFLEDLLDQAGWAYTITETAADFARELHTGGYSLYALFAEQEKLDETTQKELREAVFRGEGLLIGGPHDNRHNELAEPLGLKLIGAVSAADGVIVPDGSLGTGGAINLIAKDRALRLKRLTAEALAGYRLGAPGSSDAGSTPDCQALTSNAQPAASTDECGGNPANYLDAITLNAYGAGASILAGFDWLATATRDGASGFAATLLLAALDEIAPLGDPHGVGAVVAVELLLQNRGVATEATATMVLPAGVSLVEALDAEILPPATVQWTVNLAADEEKTLTAWLRLPDTAQTVSLAATLAAQSYTTTTDPLVVTVAEPQSLVSLAASLDAILATNPPEAQALNPAAQQLKQALSRNQLDQAVKDVLKATDSMLGLTNPAVIALRGELDQWLRWAGMRGY